MKVAACKNKISSCKVGFRLIESGSETADNRCEENQCTCAHGSGASGASCPTHESKCTSCIDTHELVGTECKRKCTDAQYRTSDGKCAEKECACDNGDGVTGASCPTHSAKVCSKCDVGYDLRGTECVKCNVENAIEYSTACVVSKCKDGFTPDGASCRAFEGSCQNGKAKSLSERTKDSQCDSCEAGFKLTSDESCVACPSGSFSPGGKTTECTKHRPPCSAAQYQTQTATPESDRMCSDLTPCGSDEYESLKPALKNKAKSWNGQTNPFVKDRMCRKLTSSCGGCTKNPRRRSVSTNTKLRRCAMLVRIGTL